MALQQTAGLVECLVQVLGLNRVVRTLNKLLLRQKALAVANPYRASDGPPNPLIESNGVKEEVEGQCNTRKHGDTKNCPCRKLDVGVDEKMQNIHTSGVTVSNIDYTPMLPELIDQIPADFELNIVTAVGTVETRNCHDAVADRGAHAFNRPEETPRPKSPNQRRNGPK